MAKLHFLVGTVFVVGVVILALAAKLRQAAQAAHCVNARLNNSLTGLLSIGIIFVVFGVTVGGLLAKGVIRTYELEVKLVHITITLVLLGIVLITLGAIIANEGKNGCEAVSSLARGVYAIGIVMVILGISSFFMNREALAYAKERVAMAQLYKAFRERNKKADENTAFIEPETKKEL